jgi:predicted transcriptional regulator
VEELVNKCIAKLSYSKGYTKSLIFASIQSLENKKWIVSNQRRTRDEILNSPLYQKIIAFLYKYPGIHARDERILKELLISRNPFIKHMMILEAFGLIRSKKIGRTENYFCNSIPDIFDDYLVLFGNPLVPKIINLILSESSINLSEIARKLDVCHGAIQYHLSTLQNLGILIPSTTFFNVNKEILRRYNQIYTEPSFQI